MRGSRIYFYFKRTLYSIGSGVNKAGVSILLLLMCLITLDVILRYFFNAPLKSVYELVSIIVLVVVCLGMAYTAITKSLVNVDILLERLPPRVKAAVEAFNSFLGVGLFSLISWKSGEQAMVYWAKGSSTYVAALPIFPLTFLLSFSMGLLSLVMLVQLIDAISEVIKK